MSFFEIETWKPRVGYERDHDGVIRQWFASVKQHHDD